MPSQFYRQTMLTKSAGAAYDDIETLPILGECYLEVDHIAVENKTTAYTSLRIGAKKGSDFVGMEQEDSPAAATIYHSKNVLRFFSNERVCCRMTGCTSGDIIEVTVQGRVMYV